MNIFASPVPHPVDVEREIPGMLGKISFNNLENLWTKPFTSEKNPEVDWFRQL